LATLLKKTVNRPPYILNIGDTHHVVVDNELFILTTFYRCTMYFRIEKENNCLKYRTFNVYLIDYPYTFSSINGRILVYLSTKNFGFNSPKIRSYRKKFRSFNPEFFVLFLPPTFSGLKTTKLRLFLFGCFNPEKFVENFNSDLDFLRNKMRKH
jgi:hypothetical protein